MALPTDTVFFSYSHRNTDFALNLANKLRSAGADIWIDRLDIETGSRWDNSIEEALENSNTFLIIISKDSMASENVLDEVSYAIEENKQIVPVLMEPCKIKFRLRRFQYADFSTDPKVGMQTIIEVLKLNETVANKLREEELVEFAKNSDDEKKIENDLSPNDETYSILESKLISPVEIASARQIFKKGITQYSIFIGVLIAVAVGLIVYNFVGQLDSNTVTIVGSIFPILLGGLPFNEIGKKKKRIDLINLFEIKRMRLQKIISKLTEQEVENLNEEFTKLIAV